jgi:uncharacterized membrane protein
MDKHSSDVAMYIAVLASFAIIDGAWIAFVAAPMFRDAVGSIMLQEPKLLAAVPFYAIYAWGIVVLAVRPSLTASSSRTALENGGVLGLTAYATFEFTSLAILKGWTLALVVTDLIWGTLLTAVVAFIGHKVGMRGLKNHGLS